MGIAKSVEKRQEYEQLVSRFESVDRSDSSAKRVLYSDISLLLIDIKHFDEYKGSADDKERIIRKLHDMLDEIPLGHVKRNTYLLVSAIDEIVRLIAVWSTLMLSATFLALPCLLVLQPTENLLLAAGFGLGRHSSPTLNLKRFIAYVILKVSGISLVVQNREVFERASSPEERCKPTLVTFSHASTMDAFIMSYAVPIRTFSISKYDLFLIPFFSWLLSAFGGISIDRNNRSKALLAVEAAAALASRNGGAAVQIAPEGTRSKSGQLMEFKKGPFYLQEQLQADIIPVVSFGAFDLYPPGRQMSLPGRVYVRFLEPIRAAEAATRGEMAALLRTRMLRELKKIPADTGAELTWAERAECLLWIALIFAADAAVFLALRHIFEGRGTGYMLVYLLVLSLAVTAILFVYNVYIYFWFLPKKAVGSAGNKEE